MSVTLSPPPFLQFMNPNNSGSPAAGFLLFTYIAGTSTKQSTWTDSTQTVQNANPIVLDANGIAHVWGDPTLTYKFVLAPPNDTDPPTSPVGDGTTDNLQFPLTANSGVSLQSYPVIPAEQSAGVIPTSLKYPPYDLRRYGGDPTGVAASDTALAAAVAVCAQSNGGTIYATAGTWLMTATSNWTNAVNVSLVGDGGPMDRTASATTIKFNPASNISFITGPGCSGCSLRNLYLQPFSNGYAGTLVVLGTAAFNADTFTVTDCSIGNANNTAANYFNLDASILTYFLRCDFFGGAISIMGQASGGGSFCNVVTIRDCQFGGTNQIPIQYLGEDWLIEGCTFEAVNFTGGFKIAGAVSTLSGLATKVKGLTFIANWLGDVTRGGGIWVTFWGNGFTCHGNKFASNTSVANSYGISLNNSSGVDIRGNHFDTFTAALTFDNPTCYGAFQNNFLVGSPAFASSTNAHPTFVVNPNNPLVGTLSGIQTIANPGYVTDPSGIVRQWGTATITTGTTSISYPVTFTSALWNLLVSLSSPANSVNVVSAGSPTTSGFNAIVAGSAGNNVLNWQAMGTGT